MATAKIIDYSIRQSKAGNLMAVILFQTETKMNHTWFGSLKEGKPREITFATLKKLGLATSDLRAFNQGVKSKALNAEIEYELVLEAEYDDKGRERTRVKYIKLPGEPDPNERMSEAALAQALQNNNLEADLTAKLKGEKPSQPDYPEPDVPF